MDFFRGSSFDFSGPVTLLDQGVQLLDLTGWVATSQIRTLAGVLVADLDVTWLNAAQSLIRARCLTSTAEWVLGDAEMDFRFVAPSGQIVYSRAAELTIKKVVTA